MDIILQYVTHSYTAQSLVDTCYFDHAPDDKLDPPKVEENTDQVTEAIANLIPGCYPIVVHSDHSWYAVFIREDDNVGQERPLGGMAPAQS